MNSGADYSQATACFLLVSWYSSQQDVYKGTELFWSQSGRKSMEEGFLFSEEGEVEGKTLQTQQQQEMLHKSEKQ